jgi:glycosyltransferase involved in cell wall biosynthesis
MRLVYLGRLVAVKGLYESIEAVALLRDAGIPVRLEIAGNGPDEAGLRSRAAALGLQEEVVFRGAVFGADKDRLWLQADVLVFPTYHREGLPYALLEAMAAGVVPVTCPVGAIPDVIEDRRDGLLVPPRDPAAVAAAIRWLADHRQAAGAIARAARQRVGRDYCVERLAADFCGVYSRL